jgi:small subunit ribosomal protein S3
MSVVKHFIEDSIKKAEIDEFLRNEFERAGYGGVSITKTPLGTHLVVYTMRPGLVIGRGGETIRELAVILEEKFNLPSPQISVAEIEIPELNAHVVASRISSALKRGVHYRRAGFWGLNQIMEAGALGAEVIISGKLRTDRARYEKFRTGYLPKSGEPPRKYMKKAELHVQTKPGILGVKVRLIPPDAQFPDQVKIEIFEEEFEGETETEIVEEKAVTEEKVSKPEVPPAEEKVPVEKEKAEPTAPAAEKKAEPKEEMPKPEAPPAKAETATKKKAAKKQKVSKPKVKAETEEKTAEPEAQPVKKKKATKKKAAKPKAPAKEKDKPKKKRTKKKETESAAPAAKEKKVTKKKKKETEKKATKSKSSIAAKEKATKKKTAKPKAATTKKAKEAKK